MTRTNAREIACHLVYEMYLNDITAGEALTALMDEGYYPSLKSESDVYEEKPTGKQLEYLENVVQGVQAKRAELEGYLEKYAIGWSVGRISKVARAVMEVAMYEVLYVHDVPTGAAISEAVELTRKYENEDVVAFVNGVLGAFARAQGANEAD